MYTVLICDDDKAILNSIEIYLRHEGYEVLKAENGKQAVELASQNEIHCCVMDVMMPVMDGIAATLEIRKTNKFPIIFLSAKSEDTDKIAGLSFGGDDYVTKPFSPPLLMARVKAVVSRRNASRGNVSDPMVFEGLEINMSGREVYVDGKRANMTPKEYDLLFYLVKNRNIALTRDKLLEEVWGYDFFGDDRTVDTHIKMLRNSLGEYRKFIVTLRGMGYKFEA